jgi:enolase
MVKVAKVKAIEILDSRGNPTLLTKVLLSDGSLGVAKVPSGASTGAHEAVELRDGDDRFRGKGVQNAVRNVNTTIAKELLTLNPLAQNEVDDAMLKLDGSEGKKNLGANAILSVSMATAVAGAAHMDMPLFKYLRTVVLGRDEKYLMPIPLSNVINGGVHAGNALAIQEFMILAVGAKDGKEGIRMTSEVYHALGKRLIETYGRMGKHVGDEGGFCGYGLKSSYDAFEAIMLAIEDAGYTPKKDVVLGIDAAASEFHKDGKYSIDGKTLDAGELLDYYLDLEKTFPLQTIEDPFDEEAFSDFAAYMKKTKAQIVTDDLTVTNPEIVKRAIEEKAGNALLLKVNQIGSVSEAIEAARVANDADWGVVVSHRSGETGDTFIADLVVALSTGELKSGAPARSDRVEKYNRLLEIYDILEGNCGYPGTDFTTSWRNYQ